MAAYIVGMIVGGVCAVSSLIYLGSVNVCVKSILLEHPDFDPAVLMGGTGPSVATGVTVVGLVVLLLSALMAAFTGLRTSRPQRASDDAESAPSSEAPAEPDGPEL